MSASRSGRSSIDQSMCVWGESEVEFRGEQVSNHVSGTCGGGNIVRLPAARGIRGAHPPCGVSTSRHVESSNDVLQNVTSQPGIGLPSHAPQLSGHLASITSGLNVHCPCAAHCSHMASVSAHDRDGEARARENHPSVDGAQLAMAPTQHPCVLPCVSQVAPAGHHCHVAQVLPLAQHAAGPRGGMGMDICVRGRA